MRLIDSFLNEENIQVVDSVNDWQGAIKKASEPLLNSGAITTEYVENMIASVKKNGPYMVLADYFALMHARPGFGVNKLGMSLLVVKRPVDLSGKPVKIFFVMAAIDNKSHLESLQRIMSVFMDEESYQIILNGRKEKIISLFKEKEE
ncbi:PTS sugar transporter subunit IIA [Pediococcus acidilactici]|mgnify:CR=1 FL=1|uniref:Ascorbate-specific PTS system EIIA component n=1 Tax=Pediococcus acidilactici TaxID=1254 RepID=A0AAW8YI99_PEDAC|nr:PTS sugar transporter subunit IIA [Pediococcus acidilactici]MDV2621804.1 PTS sugar transporter subunit IIA [Pediococcus acidilactici]QQC13961.1 PTS sugar transporter subunit IIA [Pediococcus acidilactici]